MFSAFSSAELPSPLFAGVRRVRVHAPFKPLMDAKQQVYSKLKQRLRVSECIDGWMAGWMTRGMIVNARRIWAVNGFLLLFGFGRP